MESLIPISKAKFRGGVNMSSNNQVRKYICDLCVNHKIMVIEVNNDAINYVLHPVFIKLLVVKSWYKMFSKT